jgi:hypothetical protein
MASFKSWISGGAAAGWDEVLTRSVVTWVVGFATLCVKDGIESGDWGDWVSPFTDSLAVAAVMFVVNALLKGSKR